MVCLAVVGCGLFIWLAAASAILLTNLAQQVDGALGTFLVDKGGGRLMRRILLILAAAAIVLTLKKFGWRGWKDCGWTLPDGHPRPGRWNQFLAGMVIGIMTLGSIAAITILTGLHQFKPLVEPAPRLATGLLMFVLSGLVIALVEETICRGILFRVFARAWNFWPAAFVISLFFAGAHFIGPGENAFQGDSFFRASFNAAAMTFASIIPPVSALLHFANLVLLGLVLCAFVARTGTIWMAVGAHAAWVTIIKLHAHFTDFNTAAAACIWQGTRNDFMDSLTATALFCGLIILTLWGRNKAGLTVKIRGKFWHLLPSAAAPLADFIKSGEELFAGGRVLKAYPGCRVAAKDGLVLKKYTPRNALAALRFAFHPLRTRRAFELARDLSGQGVPTPPVLGWSTDRRGGLLQSEAMIVSELKNARSLTSWLEPKSADASERLKVMRAYGSLAAAFHRNRYSNRDLKHENVMCSAEKPWVLWAVDLDGVRKRLVITRGRAGKDLFRIGKSLAALGWTGPDEIAAFFEAYNSALPPRLRRHSFPG